MIAGQLLLDQFNYQTGTKTLPNGTVAKSLLLNSNTGIVIEAVFSEADFDEFISKIAGKSIIPATVIPGDAKLQ